MNERHTPGSDPVVVKQAGFTLTEILITVVVAAVLMGVAAPSMQGAAQNARISSAHNQLAGALQRARSEAIKRSGNVTVCAREDDSTCGDDWQNGWLVFTDSGANRGEIETGESVLAVTSPLLSGIRVSNRGKLAAGSGGIAARPFVRFNGRGTSNWRGGGTFVFCDNRDSASLHALNVVLTGDIRNARKSGSDFIGAFGTAVTCPTVP